MTVKELILELQKMPQDARVFHLWDGRPRTAINVVYEAKKNGTVITADFEQVCYDNAARPKNAPGVVSERYWQTEKAPDNYNSSIDDLD